MIHKVLQLLSSLYRFYIYKKIFWNFRLRPMLITIKMIIRFLNQYIADELYLLLRKVLSVWCLGLIWSIWRCSVVNRSVPDRNPYIQNFLSDQSRVSFSLRRLNSVEGYQISKTFNRFNWLILPHETSVLANILSPTIYLLPYT